MIVSENHEMISLSYNFPHPYDLSSVTHGREKGWVVWVCQRVGPKDYRHYGRGQHSSLNEAAVIAITASEKHKRACEQIGDILQMTPDQEIKELF